MAEFSARQVVVIAAIAGALVGGLVAGGVAVAASGNSNSTASSSGGSSPAATAPVVRTNLTTTVQVGGSIGHDGSYTVAALRGGGVCTWLPEPGQVIKQDQPVASVSNEPVPLLYGFIPAYRTFEAGMSDGADVGQLTHDLIALGYGAGLIQSDHYSSATAAAVVSPGRTPRPCPTRNCRACGPGASASCSSNSFCWMASACSTTWPAACSTGAGGPPSAAGSLRRRSSGSGSAIAPGTGRTSCQAASSSAPPSPGPWPAGCLVMADEPTGNLDTATGASILDLLRELHRDGTTIVVITHDPDVAAAMERHIEIRDGRIIRDTPAGM